MPWTRRTGRVVSTLHDLVEEPPALRLGERLMKSMILIQHCQSQHHVNAEARLWPDGENGLTTLGRRQAGCLASRLRDELEKIPCRLYASDMRRSYETADIIGKEIGQTPSRVPELREWNGRFAVERTQKGEEWTANDGNGSLFDSRPFPGAETWREFYARVSTGMQDLARRHDSAYLPILVVHGGSKINIIIWWLRAAIDAFPDKTPFAGMPGSITVLGRHRSGQPIVDRLNDAAHLDSCGIAPRLVSA